MKVLLFKLNKYLLEDFFPYSTKPHTKFAILIDYVLENWLEIYGKWKVVNHNSVIKIIDLILMSKERIM